VEESEPGLWFEKTERGLRVRPISWQGRTALALYLFLVVVAIVTYSRLYLTVFVVAFYTIALGFVLVVKSDLMKGRWPPQ